jgi:hypothetical protein
MTTLSKNSIPHVQVITPEANGTKINDDSVLNVLLFAVVGTFIHVRLFTERIIYFAQHHKTVFNGKISIKI